ncbi:MAG TPA: isoprenylcysteine carboxylmethyltransferase family protein [Acidiferrobacterales bacterium]|jgi:protein-S-isoprenylcysteine O-methyltransferase Ste14
MVRRLKAPTTSTFGLKKLLSDVVHRRYRHRQFVTIAYLVFLAIVGQPWRFPPEAFWVATVLVVIGSAVRLWASGHVKKDKALATNGPYAYVRHPLYVGNHTIALGFCLASGLWWSLPVWIVLGLIYYPTTIRHEDQVLHKLFGTQWEEWRSRTRALIPRLTPYRKGDRGEWSFMQSLKVNGEPVILAIIFGLLYWLYTRLPMA